jgi:hypothetical protein
MPVPPPEIFELGTAVAATPLKVTLVILALVAVLFSHPTPTITILSVPLPSVWDQLSDETAVVDAVVLAELKAICPEAGAARTNNVTVNATTDTTPERINLRHEIAGLCDFANMI